MSSIRALLVIGLFTTTAFAGVNRWTVIGPPANIEAMAVDPHNPQILYAAGNDVVARSDDRGATWTSTPIAGLLFPSAIRVAVSIPTTLYVLGHAELYRSTTAGASWTPREMPSSQCIPMDLQVDARNADVIVMSCWNFCFLTCSGGGVYRSQNGGGSWKRIGLNDMRVSTTALDPSSLQVLYAISDRKLYKTTNGGSSWNQLSPVANGETYTIAVDPVVPTTIYATAESLESSGLFRSTNSGQTWELIRASRFGGSVVVTPYGSRIVFTGSALSLDVGRTWHQLLSTTDSGLDARSLSQIVVSPDGTCYLVTDLVNAPGQILSYEVRFPRRRAVR